MNDGALPAPRERGWGSTLLALAAFLILPVLPVPAVLLSVPAVLPIDNTLWLLMPLLAACFLAGWGKGGSASLALVWSALAAFALSRPSALGPGRFDDLARGWALLVAGTFGLFCILGSGRFLARGMSAAGVAIAAGVMLVTLMRVPDSRPRDLVSGEFAARNGMLATYLDRSAAAAPARIAPQVREWAEAQARLARAASALAAQVVASMLVLESLAAGALAWALYHRLSRTRLGAPLAPLREFRFNDQLIWGLVAGIILILLPSPAILRTLGLNLVVFFGVLYCWRGLGVMVWFAARLRRSLKLLLLFIALVFAPLTLAVGFALGLNDSWFDLRSRGPRDPPIARAASTR